MDNLCIYHKRIVNTLISFSQSILQNNMNTLLKFNIYLSMKICVKARLLFYVHIIVITWCNNRRTCVEMFYTHFQENNSYTKFNCRYFVAFMYQHEVPLSFHIHKHKCNTKITLLLPVCRMLHN